MACTVALGVTEVSADVAGVTMGAVVAVLVDTSAAMLGACAAVVALAVLTEPKVIKVGRKKQNSI